MGKDELRFRDIKKFKKVMGGKLFSKEVVKNLEL